MVLIFAQLLAVFGCFNYDCSTLTAGVCAELDSTDSNLIHLNTMGCQELTCNRTYVESQFASGRENTAYCYEQNLNQTAYTIELNYFVECDARNESSNYFQNLSEFLSNTCEQNCISENGEISPCVCGLDGGSYCYPNRSSGIYEDFWNICSQNNGKIDFKTQMLWNYVSNHFIEILTAPYCTDDIYTDITSPNLDYIIDEFQEILGLFGSFLFLSL